VIFRQGVVIENLLQTLWASLVPSRVFVGSFRFRLVSVVVVARPHLNAVEMREFLEGRGFRTRPNVCIFSSVHS